MKNRFLKNVFINAVILGALGYGSFAFSHSGGAALDPAGNNAGATDLAVVTCSDDGNGTPAYLYGQIKDDSVSIPGMFVSFHIYKGKQMLTSTDSVSGDSNYSPAITLWGGAGDYYISATKTMAGIRVFEVSWHCMTANGVHTGTDLGVLQVQ